MLSLKENLPYDARDKFPAYCRKPFVWGARSTRYCRNVVEKEKAWRVFELVTKIKATETAHCASLRRLFEHRPHADSIGSRVYALRPIFRKHDSQAHYLLGIEYRDIDRW